MISITLKLTDDVYSLIDEPKVYHLEERNGPPIVLKPGKGFDYCLKDKMTIVPLNDGDGLKLDATLIDV